MSLMPCMCRCCMGNGKRAKADRASGYRQGVLDTLRVVDEKLTGGEKRPGFISAAVVEKLLPEVAALSSTMMIQSEGK